MIKSSLKIEEYPRKKTFFEKTKIKEAALFLKDFVFNHEPTRVKYVWNKSYKIKFHTACDLFPIYILPQFAIYKWVRNIGFSFGFLFFRIDIDFISLLD
jgi:hypothetical protein